MTTPTPTIFLQTRPTTCGVACLMMALSALGDPLQLTKGVEGAIFRLLRLKERSIVPAVSLAEYAAKKGYSASAVLEDGPTSFWDYLRNTDPIMLEGQERAYASARAAGVTIRKHATVNEAALRRSLSEGNLLVAGTNLMEGVKHAILIYAAAGDTFHAIDPLSGARQLSGKALLNDMNMEFGKWYIEIRRS